ncbi:MAG: Tetracycline resistance protein, class B [Chlamydiae bacterium]|nr:Tetracycline resistance protein, class B [Chlamydiota bacterium]
MKESVWSRRFFPVLLTYFIDTFGLAIVYPIFTPLFLKPQLHLLGTEDLFQRTFLLGLLIASFPLAQFFGAPLIGGISDRIGRKKVFIGTITGGIIGYLLTGVGIHLRDLTLLWFGRTITGFFAGNLTLCLAAIVDISHTQKERTRNFGWIGVLGGLGFVLAILIGGSFSNPDLNIFFRPEIPFFITGILSGINLLLILRFFRESKTKPHDKIEILKSLKNIGCAIRSKEMRSIYIVYFLFMLGWVTSMQFLSTYLIDIFNVSINVITLTFVSIGLIWSLANFIINPILSRLIHPSRTFYFGLVFLSLFLFLTLIPHEPLFVFLIHFFIATFAAALSWTNGLATISLNASKLMQGSILGVNQSIVAMASIVGPIVGGLIAGLDIHKLFCFTASCSLLGALLLFIRSFGIKQT